MAGPTPLPLPRPLRLDEFRDGAIDVRGIDLTVPMQVLDDTITSVAGLTVVSRDDGVPLVPDDLHILLVPAVPWVENGYMVGWWQTSGGLTLATGVSVDYQITITVQTAQGRTYIVDAMQLVTPIRG